ncbi:type I-U CRISPR-associated helicase/endonuclease Cas3, partial [Micromonospora sp. CPCC 206060]|uniref:type I-G CRISPR-associated helicase/endonuclease Cas3g n=1 Tax=Micromonospora sp. CPCC 206060 TaxID=3122406 RepID=UPI002FEFF408
MATADHVLTPDDFAGFVNEVHGDLTPGGQLREPFPWQQALLDRILAEGRWPDVIDVPTGLGKTSVLDVSVFVAALRPDLAKRRTFFVVDRRLVVDEAHEHAVRLNRALQTASTPICARVAEALRAEGDEDGPVLTVTRMRGGATWDRIWLERPDRYAIIAGTVDQVGSRLLFRGYGVNEYGRSIDAALVGTDSLIVVDEAHLAEAFRATVTAALNLDDWPLGLRPALVIMSATTPDDTGRQLIVHSITDRDRHHPVAGGRLTAPKRLRLVEVATSRRKASLDVPRALADLTLRLTPEGVVAVVVNTVSRARAVFELLNKEVEAILLTGRGRGIDRELLLAGYYDRIRVGRDYDDRRPFVIVATQTIEVGANIDVDALVTDSASLPALIQRLGRLNRLGLRDVPAPAYVVHDSSTDDEDPVYGQARLTTWRWLTEQAPISTLKNLHAAADGLPASPAALRTMAATAPPEASIARPVHVPVLLPPTLDAWTRTSPTPHPDPPIAPYLHGITDEVPPVTIAWRAGLPLDAPERWAVVAGFVPTTSTETIDVPAREVRRWLLQHDDAQPVADIDIPEPAESDPRSAQPEHRGRERAPRSCDDRERPQVLRYRCDGTPEIITAQRIRPGDTIVVPVEYGGCDRFGWHPDSNIPAVDVADLAARKRGPILRLGPHLRHLAAYLTTATLTTGTASDQPANAHDSQDAINALLHFVRHDPEVDRPHAYRDRLKTLLATLASDNLLGQVVQTLLGYPSQRQRPSMTATPTRQLDPVTGAVWTPEFPILLSAARPRQADDESETGSSSSAYPGKRIGLDPHQRAVAARAAQMARNIGLDLRLTSSVRVAGELHDEGKRDIRFQTMLFAGRRAAAELAPEPLAKSGIDPANKTEARRARDAAGYPPKMRHEALSARIAALHLTTHPQRAVTEIVSLSGPKQTCRAR